MGQIGGVRDSAHNIGAAARSGEVKRMRLYKVQGDSDMTEGRGPARLVGYFVDLAVAERAGKGQCAMGTDARPETVTATVVKFQNDAGEEVYGLVKEYVQIEFEDPNEVKARALAKLTDKEKKALGLR